MINSLIDKDKSSNGRLISELLIKKKWPPKDIDDWIDDRSHWLSSENLDRIDQTIKKIHENTDGKKCLDVGFGNCLVLLRELKIFPSCIGLYITLKKALEKGVSKSILIEGNCYQIPFESEEFDLVSAYGLLHLLPDTRQFFIEAYKVLKKGGYLYTDGDKTIYIVKLIRKIKMTIFHLGGKKYKEKYELWCDILNPRDDYHHEGIDYVELERALKEIGFEKVIITPRLSVKPSYYKKLPYRIITKILPLFKFKFCYSHVQILAIK